MHFKSLSLLALSAVGAVASQDKRQALPSDPVGQSVLLVLLTAIPPDSLSLAQASPSAFSSELASSISAGNPPAWYVALPSDVKSYLPKLYPASTAAVTTAPATTAPAVTPPASISGSPAGGNSTAHVTVSSATLKSTGGANSQKPTSTPSSGGASYPTAVVGAGVAGLVGFLGMLAL